MAWAKQGRVETPLYLELIESAMGLYRDIVREQELPPDKARDLRDKIGKLRDRTKLDGDFRSPASKQLKSKLLQCIGERTLNGYLTIGGKNIGPMVMWVLCHPYEKSKRTLEVVLELSNLLEFIMGGYNLKEQTELAIRADQWLEEMRGHRTLDDITRRRRVDELLPDLLEFLDITTHGKNYKQVEEARAKRESAPDNTDLNAASFRPSNDELAGEIDLLKNRVAESWGFLRRLHLPEIAEVEKIRQKNLELVPLYEEEITKLRRRVKGRERRLASLEKEGRIFSDEERKERLMTEQEEKWLEETEGELFAILAQKRVDFLWSSLREKILPEIDFILSASSRTDWLRAEMGEV